MRPDNRSMTGKAVTLGIAGLLAGLVVAAAAFPGAAMSGLAAKAGAETFDKLPSELTVKQAPQITYVYANDGKTLLATMYDENRSDTRLANMSPLVLKAIIAAEDHQFYEHNGVDPKGIARALVVNNKGDSQQGGSTLTMQYVRQAISYSAESPAEVVAATENTPARKLREMRYAMSLEKKISKDEILERYLNIAPFGNGTYGVFAASKVYFEKAPKDLTIDEAAMLAGMVKAPSAFNPTTATGKPQAEARRNYVIDQMVATGAITADDATKAKAVPLVVKGKRTPNGCVATKENHWGFFCDYFYRWWLDQPAFGETAYDRERTLMSRGYRVVSSLDPKVQEVTKKAVERHYPTGRRHALMLASVEPGTGRVRALATNRNYKLDDPRKPKNGESTNPAKRRAGIRGTYPNTTNPLVTGGGDIMGYQAGSTFKMFTMAAALEKGYPLSYTINATSPVVTQYPQDSGPAACGGRWCPRNANPKWMNGNRNMWSGFGRSVNTYFVRLEEKIGADAVVEMAKRLGIKFREPKDLEMATTQSQAESWGAFTLGVSLTTPLDLASAYATLAADGKYCEPTPVQEIVDSAGNKIRAGEPRCEQRIKPETARATLDAARCPIGDSSSTDRCDGGTASYVRGTVGKPVAGKTGTTDGDRTATLALTSRQLTTVGTMADPDWAQTSASMRPEAVNMAVSQSMRDALSDQPRMDFETPGSNSAEGDQRRIPNVACRSVEEARSRLKSAGFQVEIAGPPGVPSSCAAGSAASTDPRWVAPKGSTILIQVSSGKPKATRPPAAPRAAAPPPASGSPRIPTSPGLR
ncbi:transglycosylase domain-containing protein [Pilimelia terevasa]|uniref:transglycosylase domain-containing protein n=1 Tax=Pilimelia terevasa TaxID=53372 RepID=UPI00357118C7